MSKSVLVDFSRSKHVEQPNMILQQQVDYAIGRASKCLMAYWRLARVASGVNLWLMRQLYMAVAIPKMMCVIDVWLTLPQ